MSDRMPEELTDDSLLKRKPAAVSVAMQLQAITAIPAFSKISTQSAAAFKAKRSPVQVRLRRLSDSIVYNDFMQGVSLADHKDIDHDDVLQFEGASHTAVMSSTVCSSIDLTLLDLFIVPQEVTTCPENLVLGQTTDATELAAEHQLSSNSAALDRLTIASTEPATTTLVAQGQACDLRYTASLTESPAGELAGSPVVAPAENVVTEVAVVKPVSYLDALVPALAYRLCTMRLLHCGLL